jgi:hypothetical protein
LKQSHDTRSLARQHTREDRATALLRLDESIMICSAQPEATTSASLSMNAQRMVIEPFSVRRAR